MGLNRTVRVHSFTLDKVWVGVVGADEAMGHRKREENKC